MKLAFIGTGVMGGPMAGHLAKAGHAVTVYNRSPQKARAWAARHGGAVADTPAAASRDAALVFSCVGNDDDLREVTIGANGAFQAMGADAIYVDHTTTSAGVAEALHAEARKRGIHFLDAPVSGGQSGAEQGVLTVMVGGDAAAFSRVEPVIAH
jgi:3-hydroxyisobutyrate dehydrogenase